MSILQVPEPQPQLWLSLAQLSPILYLTFSASEDPKEIGRGIGGLWKAPLNLMMKISPPRWAPWGVPAGRARIEDTASPYESVIVRPER